MSWLFELRDPPVFRNKEGSVRVSASAASYPKSEVSFQLARAEDRPADLSACQPTEEFSTNCLPPLNQPDELRLFFQHAHRVKAPFRTKNVALSMIFVGSSRQNSDYGYGSHTSFQGTNRMGTIWDRKIAMCFFRPSPELNLPPVTRFFSHVRTVTSW